MSRSPQWHLPDLAVCRPLRGFSETKPSGPHQGSRHALGPVCPAVSRARLPLPPSNALLGVRSQLGPVEGHPDAGRLKWHLERERHGDDLPGPAGRLCQHYKGDEDQELHLGADHTHQRRQCSPDAPEPLRCGVAACPSLPLPCWSVPLCFGDFSLSSGVFLEYHRWERMLIFVHFILLPSHPCYLGCFKCGWALLKFSAPALWPSGSQHLLL